MVSLRCCYCLNQYISRFIDLIPRYMIFRRLVFFTIIVSFCALQVQAHKRKTRSDKGGHHKHSPAYYLKHGYSGHSESTHHDALAYSSADIPLPIGTSTEDSLRLSGIEAQRAGREAASNRGLTNVAIILAVIFSISIVGYIITQRKQRQKREQAEQERIEALKKKKELLLLKYSAEEVLKLLKHEYWIGMTEEQLVDAKGKPDKIEVEQMKTKTKRIYIYGNKSSGDVFNFVNGTLERFKDR